MVVSKNLSPFKTEIKSSMHGIQRLMLSIKAELENVTDLVPADDEFEYFFEVCNRRCHNL